MINKLLKYFGYKLVKISDLIEWKWPKNESYPHFKTFTYNPEDYKYIFADQAISDESTIIKKDSK